MNPDVRVVNVSLGAREFVTATLTECNGLTIAGEAMEMAVATSEGPAASGPTAWQAPELTVNDGPVIAGRILVTNAWPPGDYYAFARLVDSPETSVLIDKLVIRVR